MIFTIIGIFLFTSPVALLFWGYLAVKYAPLMKEGHELNKVIIPRAIKETQRIETSSRARRARMRKAREKELLKLLDIGEYKECKCLQVAPEEPLPTKYRYTKGPP